MQSSPNVHIVDHTHMHHIIFNHAHTYRDTWVCARSVAKSSFSLQGSEVIFLNGGCNLFLNLQWRMQCLLEWGMRTFLNADDKNLIVCNGGCNFFLWMQTIRILWGMSAMADAISSWMGELFLNADDKNLIVCNGAWKFFLNEGCNLSWSCNGCMIWLYISWGFVTYVYVYINNYIYIWWSI